MNSRKDRIGAIPGTMSVKSGVTPHITLFDYNKQRVEESKLTVSEFEKLGKLKPGMVRLVVAYNYKSAEFMQTVKEKYGLHSLSLEDITNTDQRNKYESYDEYELCIINKYSRRDKRQMSIVLCKGNIVFLFVEGTEPEYCLDPVLDRIRNDKGRIRNRDAGYVAYSILDVIVDTYFVLLENLETELERFDSLIAEEQSASMVKELFDLKKEIIQVKKNTWPLRDMVSGIQRDENSLFLKDPKNGVYIRDLHDHVNYITESSDNLRDGVYSLVEMHTNFVGMRMNEIMRVLTVITTIFAPIMFIASIYGMNFDIPELHLRYGYMLFWVAVAALTLLQWRYYKKKRWI